MKRILFLLLVSIPVIATNPRQYAAKSRAIAGKKGVYENFFNKNRISDRSNQEKANRCMAACRAGTVGLALSVPVVMTMATILYVNYCEGTRQRKICYDIREFAEKQLSGSIQKT